MVRHVWRSLMFLYIICPLFLVSYVSYYISRNFKLSISLPLFWLLTDPLQHLFSVFGGLSNLQTKVSIPRSSFAFGINWKNPGHRPDCQLWRMIWPCMMTPWERYLDQKPDSSRHQIVPRNFSLLKTPFSILRSSTGGHLSPLSENELSWKCSVQSVLEQITWTKETPSVKGWLTPSVSFESLNVMHHTNFS